MKKVSSDIKWFCDQLREAEQILSNALEKAEDFSDYDKQLVDRIESDVQMVDLTLLQLLSPIAPQLAMGNYSKKQLSLWYLRYFKCCSSSFTKCKLFVSPMVSLSNLSNSLEYIIFPFELKEI